MNACMDHFGSPPARRAHHRHGPHGEVSASPTLHGGIDDQDHPTLASLLTVVVLDVYARQRHVGPTEEEQKSALHAPREGAGVLLVNLGEHLTRGFAQLTLDGCRHLSGERGEAAPNPRHGAR